MYTKKIPITKPKKPHTNVIKVLLGNAAKAKSVVKNVIENFESHIDSKDPTTKCLDIAIITAEDKRTKKKIDKLKTVAGRVLNK